jgi:hypothetical protein
MLNDKHYTDLHKKSGLTKETIEKCGYRSSNDAWEVDFCDPYTGEVKLTIKRLDNPAEGQPKYLQPKDTKTYPYFSKLVNWQDVFKDTNKPVIITEGTKKADCANQHGFTAVAIQGTYGWSYKKKLIDSMKWTLNEGRTIYICFDSDQLEKEQVKDAVLALAKEAYRRGSKVRTINLPRHTKGIDDFFVYHCPNGENLEHGVKMFQDLIDTATDPLIGSFLSHHEIKSRIYQDDQLVDCDYSKLPKILVDYHLWVKDSTHAPDALSILGFIGVVASALGKQVMIEAPSKKLYPNLWACGIAASGTGKTTAFNISLDLLQEINIEQVNILLEETKFYDKSLKQYDNKPDQHEVPERPKVRVPILPSITSKEKLYESLAYGDGSGVMSTSEELSTLIEDINNDRNTGFKPLLISLYGGSKAAPLMSFKNTGMMPAIEEPAVSILGVSTLGSFFKSFESNDFTSGLLQRFCFVVGKSNKPKLAFPIKRCPVQEDRFRNLIRGLFDLKLANSPIVHKLSSEALSYWGSIYTSLDNEFGYIHDDSIISCFSRYNDELTFKIALVFHYLEENMNTMEVSKATLEKAISYVKFLKHCLLHILKEKQSSNIKSLSNKMVEKLSTQDEKSLTYKKLKDRLGAYRNEYLFDESLDFLSETGVVEIKEVPSGSNNDTVSKIIYLMVEQ